MEKDKLYHLIAGFLISAILGVRFDPMESLLLGMWAGVGKELYDFYDYGVFDVKDMLFTFLGAFLGAGIWYLYYM